MRVIYKYPIPVCEKYELSLPLYSEILRVDDVEGFFYLWALVDTNITETETRYLELYKTGQEIDHIFYDKLKYLGFCKIFIGMELGLYVFENITKLQRSKFNVVIR